MKNKQQEIETLAKLVASTTDCPYLNEALKIVEAQFKQDISSDFITIISIRDNVAQRVAYEVELAKVKQQLDAASAQLRLENVRLKDVKIQLDEARSTVRQLVQRLACV